MQCVGSAHPYTEPNPPGKGGPEGHYREQGSEDDHPEERPSGFSMTGSLYPRVTSRRTMEGIGHRRFNEGSPKQQEKRKSGEIVFGQKQTPWAVVMEDFIVVGGEDADQCRCGHRGPDDRRNRRGGGEFAQAAGIAHKPCQSEKDHQ